MEKAAIITLKISGTTHKTQLPK